MIDSGEQTPCEAFDHPARFCVHRRTWSPLHAAGAPKIRVIGRNVGKAQLMIDAASRAGYVEGLTEAERRTVERIVAWHNEMRDRHDRMCQQHGFSTKAFEHAAEAERHHKAAQDIERGDWRTPTTGAGGEE